MDRSNGDKFRKLCDSSHAISFLSRTYRRLMAGIEVHAIRLPAILFPITRGKRVYSIVIGGDYNREGDRGVRGGLLLLAEGYCLREGGDWMFGDRSLNRRIGRIGRRDIAPPRYSSIYRLWSWLLMDRRGINGR